MKKIAIKGDIVFTKKASAFETYQNSYLLCKDGKCCGIKDSLKDTEWENVVLFDYTGKLIIPGFCDLHMHAPQYSFRGMGMDMPLLDWLNTYTFPEESKFSDKEYAKKMYTALATALLKSPTTRAVLFGTIHTESTLILADLLEKTGLKVFLGKVNMDRNSPESLIETKEDSIRETERFLEGISKYKNVKPIITPRFVPSCSGYVMDSLGGLSQKNNLPIQSHLDENLSEIQWVKELHPDCKDYTSVYKKYNLLDDKTIMAHCIYMSDEEQSLIKEQGSFIAHCPLSNINLCSGAAPVVEYLKKGIKVGIGTDIGAGSSMNMFKSASDAVLVSKLRKSLLGDERYLSESEAFYLATKSGASFFGKTGSFEESYELDALIVDDSGFSPLEDIPLDQRAARVLYLGGSEAISAKFVAGERIYEKA